MKYFFVCTLFILISHISSSQLVMSDSIRKEIQFEFSKRDSLEQMKDFPCYFTTCKSDSLTEIRRNRFIDNFNYILSLTKKYGFPSNSRIFTNNYLPNNNKMAAKVFVYMTFIHILQTKPSLLINLDFANLFLEEEKKGNVIIKTYYDNAIMFAKMQHLLCLSEMDTVNKILTIWSIPVYVESDFKKCN